MSDTKQEPQDAERSHRALIERPLSTALSTNVLHPVQGAAGEDEDVIDLREYWQIIVKRKWTVIVFFLIVVTAVTTATFLMTPIYRATTVLQIEKEAAKVVEFKDATPIETSGDRDFYQTQYELLKSHSLAQRVIEQLGLAHADLGQDDRSKSLLDWGRENFSGEGQKASNPAQSLDESKQNHKPLEAFLAALTVEPVKNSRLVKVSFDNPDPVMAARVANAVAGNFIDVNLERRFNANSYAKDFLEERIKQVKAKLEETERAQVEFARSQEIFSVDKDGATTDAQNLQEFNSALAKAQQDRIKAEALYRQVQDPRSGELPQMVETDLIKKLKESRAKLQAEYQDNLKIYKPGYSKMQELSGQIAELTTQIAAEEINVRSSLKASYEAAKLQEDLLSEKLAKSKKDMLDLQNRSIQYNILKREADTNRQLYEGLLQRLKEVSVAGGVGTNNISVVDKAEVPLNKFKPNLRLNLMIATLLGLLGGIGLALFFEHLDDTFKQAADVERFLGLPVLGLVPESRELREGDNVLRLVMEDSRSALAEAYRSVRTALQFSTELGAPKVLGITSTNMAEGKSTSSLSLAVQFAQFGSRVLLIDADLRNPSLHRVLGGENTLGLTNYLAGTAQPVAITRNTPVANLFVITTGPLPPNPAELLSGQKMRELLDLAADKFDHVIIDSPPILGLADALIIANLAHEMLLVVAAGDTRRVAAQSCVKRLVGVRARPLGCLLTKMNGKAHGYGDYGYEYYYGGHRSNINTSSQQTAA